MPDDVNDDAGALLNLLGNNTRRKILGILANEPMYFIQLSRALGVSQQAVLKHLSLLEDFGLVSSFRAKSDRAAPDRKYFKLDRSLYLSVGIAGDNVEIDLKNLESDYDTIPDIGGENIRELILELKAMDRVNEVTTVMKKTDSLVRAVDMKMEELENEKMALIRVKQHALQTAHKMIRNSMDDSLGRQILYAMISSPGRIDIETLSEVLNAREKEIRTTIKDLEKKFSLTLT